MAHIVIIPYNIASKLNPTFELARRLQAAGHRITIVGETSVAGAAQAQDLPFFAAGDRIPMPEYSTQKVNPLRSIFFPSRAIDAAVDSMGMQGFPKILTTLEPDLILIDIEQHRYIISAVPTGISVALISTFVSLFKRPGLPPSHVGVIPGVGFKGSRLGLEYLWLRFRVGKWRGRLRNRLKKKGLDMLSLLRHHAKRTAFDFRAEVDLNQWMIPFVYRNLPLLAVITREFDFPHPSPPHYYHVGALINIDRREVVKTEDEGVAIQLDALLSEPHDTATYNKLIYCSFGAFFKGDDTRFWKKLIHALGEETGWKVIFGLGGRFEPSSLGNLPANIYAFKWVPQLRVLKFADCAIIHGGITSINECIVSGAPMLVFPFNTTDQHGAAARVAYHGVGILGDRRNDDSNTIRKRVETILNDPIYVSNVLQMRNYLQRDMRQNKAVKTIESIVNQKNE